MSKAIIELMLGNAGRYLLAVYNDYHFVINAVVIVYGVLLIWAHMNLRQWVHRMENSMIEIAQTSGQPADPQAIYQAFISGWKLSQDSRIIVIPNRNDLWFTKVSVRELADILGIQPDYIRVVLTKAGGMDALGKVPKQTYRVWELYRHQLLTGIRARHLEPDFQLKMRKGKTT